MQTTSEFDVCKYKAWLNSEDPWQRDIALNVFMHSMIRDDEIDCHAARILRTDDDVKIRRAAIKLICSYKDAKFLDYLIEALDDEDWCVKGEAFIAIKMIMPNWQKNERIIQFIEEETHPFVRFCIWINSG